MTTTHRTRIATPTPTLIWTADELGMTSVRVLDYTCVGLDRDGEDWEITLELASRDDAEVVTLTGGPADREWHLYVDVPRWLQVQGLPATLVVEAPRG